MTNYVLLVHDGCSRFTPYAHTCYYFVNPRFDNSVHIARKVPKGAYTSLLQLKPIVALFNVYFFRPKGSVPTKSETGDYLFTPSRISVT